MAIHTTYVDEDGVTLQLERTSGSVRFYAKSQSPEVEVVFDLDVDEATPFVVELLTKAGA